MKTVLIALALLLSAARGDQVCLAWDPSPDPDAAIYFIYYGIYPGIYTNSVAVGNVTTACVTGLDPSACYYFAATAMDVYGRESEFSNEVSAAPWSEHPMPTTPTNVVIELIPGP